MSSRAASFVLISTLFCSLLSARECVSLRNGFTLEIDSHEERDGILFAKVGSGTVQIPANDVLQVQTVPADPTRAKDATGLKPTATAEQALQAAAVAQGIDSAFVRSVAQVESGLRQSAISSKGALGLMQLMPQTARELEVDPQQLDSNALGGAKYLRQLLLQYKGDAGLALAAYNAGPGAVKRYKGIPPYRETREYILKVLKQYERNAKLASAKAKMAQDRAADASRPTATN